MTLAGNVFTIPPFCPHKQKDFEEFGITVPARKHVNGCKIKYNITQNKIKSKICNFAMNLVSVITFSSNTFLYHIESFVHVFCKRNA